MIIVLGWMDGLGCKHTVVVESWCRLASLLVMAREQFSSADDQSQFQYSTNTLNIDARSAPIPDKMMGQTPHHPMHCMYQDHLQLLQ